VKGYFDIELEKVGRVMGGGGGRDVDKHDKENNLTGGRYRTAPAARTELKSLRKCPEKQGQGIRERANQKKRKSSRARHQTFKRVRAHAINIQRKKEKYPRV